MSTFACPVCQHPHSDAWIRLDADGTHPTWICPECTSVCHTAALQRDGYAHRTEPLSLQWEDEDGRVHPATANARIALYRARLQMLGAHLPQVAEPLEVCDVASRDGLLLRTLASLHRARPLALEVHADWARRARARGLTVQTTTLEQWETSETFDVALDCDTLPYLSDPVEHLRRMAQRLRPHGRAFIVVPNLLAGFADLRRDILAGHHAVSFTPRALLVACLRAGLHPLQVEVGREIRVVCQRGEVSMRRMQGGPDALAVAHALWGDDLRRGIKTALAKHGPTREVLRIAARTHRRAPTPDTRADIAFEIAAGCERAKDYDRAEQWLKRSLNDRFDPEVEATLRMVRQVRGALGATQRNALEPSSLQGLGGRRSESRLAC